MPIYEYRCTACGNLFEKLQRSDAAPPVCPRCSSSDVHKELSTFSAGHGPATSHGPACSGGG